MKKILSILLLIVLVVGAMSGCAQTNDTATNSKLDPNKKAILVVSFGTSYADTRELTIDATEQRFVDAFPEYDIKRAFTSQIIIDKLQKRDGIEIDNVTEAFEKLIKEGYGEVLVQPLHIINGAEYDDLVNEANEYKEQFSKFVMSRPLLTSTEDYEIVVNAVVNNNEIADDEALVLMGHGTHHDANAAYAALDMRFKDMGHDNVFVGTVEAYPSLDDLEPKLNAKEIKKVALLPAMFVAGDHAQNDMAGDESESWKMVLKSKGYQVRTILKGLGEVKEIQDLYIEHLKTAMNTEAAH